MENVKDEFEVTSGAAAFGGVKVVDKGADTLVSFGTTKVLLKNTDHTDIGASDFLFT